MNIEKYFKYDHLPKHLQEVSKLFSDTVNDLSLQTLSKLSSQLRELSFNDRNEADMGKIKLDLAMNSYTDREYAKCKRLLLEAKDCFVRATLS